MAKSVKKNYIYNLIYEVLLLLTPLITTPYISRVLQADGVGLYSYSYSIVSYFILLAGFGSASYGKRQIAYCNGNKEKVTRVFYEVLIARLFFTLISIIIYLCFITTTTNRVLFLIQGLFLLAVAFDISWFFQGLEEFGKVVTRNIIVKILNIVFIFLFVKEKNDLYIYIAGLSTMTLIGNISIWPYLKKYIIRVSVISLRPLKHFKEMFQLFIPTIAIQVYTVLDKTMIGIFSKDTVENGYYEQAEKIVKMVLTIITSLSTVMMPRISSIYAKGNMNAVKIYMYKSYRFVWMLGFPMVVGLMTVSDFFVPWFFGSGYGKVTTLISILAVLILAIGVNTVTGQQFLISTNRQNFYTISVCIGALVNFCMNFMLIPKYYSIGASIATVVAEIIICIVQFIYISKKKLYSVSRSISSSIKYIISSIVMGGVILLCKFMLKVSVFNTFLLIAIGIVAYFLTLLILRDKLFKETILQIIKKVT